MIWCMNVCIVESYEFINIESDIYIHIGDDEYFCIYVGDDRMFCIHFGDEILVMAMIQMYLEVTALVMTGTTCI